MHAPTRASRLLGAAFIAQLVTSIGSGVALKPALIVPGNIGESMRTIAQNPALLRACILLDLLTALGVIALGAMLYVTLRGIDEKPALIALGWYILEGGLLAASQADAFALLRISQEYVGAGQPAELRLAGQLAHESMVFVGSTLHMLAFCAGAILFYALLARSRVVPRWLSLWGLIAMVPLLIGTIAQIFGSAIPFAFYLPYVPFELVIGCWILIKGVPEPAPLPRTNALVEETHERDDRRTPRPA